MAFGQFQYPTSPLVGAERRREAVNPVTALQADRHGQRVWRTAKSLLDSEHVRRAIGEVATPYGTCRERSNVAAGGHACSLRRCASAAWAATTSPLTSPFLPGLQAHLADLLRSRERLMSAFEADDWARTQARPSQEEIRRVRRLIDRVQSDLDDLTPKTAPTSSKPSPWYATAAPTCSACPASASRCPTPAPPGS
ncbi:hypothetical protein [Streptomyces chrestomyceticus]|uniref:hypothetical protein n=1 Tax=Streptomyces chrestomyceticus TaxID=68185 RepID=UPI0033F4BC2D